jgi:hypothetical protein
MERNLFKIYTKRQLREIFKTYGKPHMNYKFVKVTRRFEVDGKDYEVGDILYMVDYPLERTRAIILNRYLSQHNDFINYGYLEEKDEKLLDLLNGRCWWLESWCNRYLKPIVQSNFLYEHIEGVENEEEKT